MSVTRQHNVNFFSSLKQRETAYPLSASASKKNIQTYSDYKLCNEIIAAYPHFKKRVCIAFTNNYEKYCKLINLDEDYLTWIMQRKRAIVWDFTLLLAQSGAAYSLNIMYSDHHVTQTLKKIYEKYPFDCDYHRWLMTNIKESKQYAAYFGHLDIIKNFFPEIVSIKMLVMIFNVIKIAYVLTEERLDLPGQALSSWIDQLTEAGKEQQQSHCRMLSERLDNYKEAIQYLMRNGIDVDYADKYARRDKCMGYLSHTERVISVKYFCELYREFVPDSVKVLFDLVLSPTIEPIVNHAKNPRT